MIQRSKTDATVADILSFVSSTSEGHKKKYVYIYNILYI